MRLSRLLLPAVFLAILLLGLALRLVDLTDAPLDFHPTRQLRGAIIARAMYLQMSPDADLAQRQEAVEIWQFLEILEPPIFERIVAVTYLVIGSEVVWVARLYAILFWMIGGLALFDLARRMTSTTGGLLALAYYLILPFGVTASRAFMPDPFMVMWILLSAWAIFRWSESRTWGWALAAGLLAGLTLLVKITAIFPLAPTLLFTVWSGWGWKAAIRDRKVWTAVALLIALPGIYYLATIGGKSANYFQFWMVSFADMLISPRFYVLWLKMIGNLMGLSLVFLGLIGILLLQKNTHRLFVLGLGAGYALFGLFFPFQIHTHEYYSLMLVPIVGLSLASLGALLAERLRQQTRLWQAFAAAVLLVAVAYPAWTAYTSLIGVNYRGEAIAWENIGAALPGDGEIVALTHDYGMELLYYGWRIAAIWPTAVDFDMTAQRGNGSSPEFESLWESYTSGKTYFLVTLFSELDAQPQLKAHLTENYSVYAEGEGFVIYDLARSLNP